MKIHKDTLTTDRPGRWKVRAQVGRLRGRGWALLLRWEERRGRLEIQPGEGERKDIREMPETQSQWTLDTPR